MEQLAQLARYSTADGNFLIIRHVKIILCKRHLTLLSIMHEVLNHQSYYPQLRIPPLNAALSYKDISRHNFYKKIFYKVYIT